MREVEHKTNQRAFENYLPEPNTGCWLWLGKTERSGYPTAFLSGKECRMHREFYKAHIGPIESGLLLRHTCDVPSCVNPDHLIPGTQAENVADMIRRRRRPRGRISVKLNTHILALLHDARSRGCTIGELSRVFGASEITIRRALNGGTWNA